MGIFIEKQDFTVNTSSMYFDSPINKSTSFVKAKAPIKQGDMVRWNSSGGPATGKVTRIVAEGVIDVPDSKFKIKAEKDNPAVLINLFRAGKKTDIFVGHKMSTLKLSSMRKAEDLVKAEDDMNMVHQDAIMGGKKKKVMNAYGIEVEVDDDEEKIIMEDDKVEMGMGGYGYGMPKKKVTKHAMHDQSSHGSWAGNGLGGSSGGGSGAGDFKRSSQKRPLSDIASEIVRDPAYKKMPSKIYAEAYVQPMRSMNDIEDNYFADTGVSVVSYALANLSSYRGDTARRVKSELKAMLKPNKGKSNNFIASKPSMDEPQYMENEGKDFDSGQGRFI